MREQTEHLLTVTISATVSTVFFFFTIFKKLNEIKRFFKFYTEKAMAPHSSTPAWKIP